MKRAEGSDGYMGVGVYCPDTPAAMSTSSPFRPDRTIRPPADLVALVGRLRSLLVKPVVALSFWLAVLLPLVHLPLAATGLETTSELTRFLGLLGLNAVALVVGHGHRRG